MRYLHFHQILNPVGTSRKGEAKELTVKEYLFESYLDGFKA